MKRIATLLILIVCSLTMVAQNVTQRGVTYRYNGKHPRTPMGGVYIKPVTAANGVVSDEANGTFTLTLQKLKMGSRIGSVRVTKQGMMVFNQQAVDEWNVRQEPLRLILCDANEFQRQKKNLIAIGERQAKKKYDKQLAELKKKNQDQQLQLDDYYNKLDSLEKNYQNALQHMDEYADVFARIDESEVDTVAQRAIELFHKGDIQTAIHMLESQDYMGRLTKANTTIAQAEALISTAERAKALAEQDKEKDLQAIKTLISGYKLSNDWEKAGQLLKGLADNLKTRDAVWEYASFCWFQHSFTEAETYFLLCKEMQDQRQSLDNDVELADLQNNLAAIYLKTRRFSESEKMFCGALNIYKRLAKERPNEYEHSLAGLYNNFASLYLHIQSYRKSQSMFKRALAIYRRLFKENPKEYEVCLATSYNNTANLYLAMQRFGKSERMFKAALSIRKRLANEDPQNFESDLADSYKGLAYLYCGTKRFSESEAMFKDALSIYKRLIKDNPNAYKPILVGLYHNWGNLYSDMERFSDSDAMYKAALALAKEYTDEYSEDLADMYVVISFNSNLLGKFNDGEIYALEALKNDSTKHRAYISLATALLFQGKTEEAEKLYRQFKSDYKGNFLHDFAQLERLGVIPEERKMDVERIKAMLKAE